MSHALRIQMLVAQRRRHKRMLAECVFCGKTIAPRATYQFFAWRTQEEHLRFFEALAGECAP